MRTTIALSLVPLAALALAACASDKPPPPSLDVSPPQDSPTSIPDGPLDGKVHGAAFKLGDARYFVDQRRGYEKTDVILSAGATTDRCADTRPADATAVWLRHKGTDPIVPGEVRVKPRTPGPWEVHYQTKVDGKWRGNGDAAALLVIREIRADQTLVGDLSVCFADHEKSCVSGSFQAGFCPIRIDQPIRATEPPEPNFDKIPRKNDAGAAPGAPLDAAAPPGATPADGGTR